MEASIQVEVHQSVDPASINSKSESEVSKSARSNVSGGPNFAFEKWNNESSTEEAEVCAFSAIDEIEEAQRQDEIQKKLKAAVAALKELALRRSVLFDVLYPLFVMESRLPKYQAEIERTRILRKFSDLSQPHLW